MFNLALSCFKIVRNAPTEFYRFKPQFAARILKAERLLYVCSNMSSMSSNMVPNILANNVKDRFCLLSNEDFTSYVKEYQNVVQDVVSLQGFELMSETNVWMKEVIDYNVPHGKLLRSALLLAVAKSTQELIGNELPYLNRIGWAYEFLQGFATIHDDIMDKSKTRRNRPCWYLVNDLGEAAINDGDLLENAAYMLFKKYAKGKYLLYADIIDTLHETFYKGLYGQSLDNQLSRSKQLSRYTSSIYNKMMRFKNGYYTFYAPIAIGLMLNGVNGKELLQQIENISLDLGLLYSIQDDYIDCFIKPDKSGKIGTDIQDGKPSWLIVTAIDKCSKEQRQILIKNYGLCDPQNVANIKTVYQQLEICKMFRIWEENAINHILHEIEKLPKIAPQKTLIKVLSLLNGRTR